MIVFGTLTSVKVRTALKSSKMHPAKKYLIRPGYDVLVYREKYKRLYRPLKVIKVSDKIIYLTDDQKLKPFNIIAIISMARNANDTVLKHEIRHVERYYLTNPDEIQHQLKTLKNQTLYTHGKKDVKLKSKKSMDF